MTPSGGTPRGAATAALLESIRAAAHAAVDAGDRAAAVELMRLIEQRRRTAEVASVVSLAAARKRREEGGGK